MKHKKLIAFFLLLGLAGIFPAYKLLKSSETLFVQERERLEQEDAELAERLGIKEEEEKEGEEKEEEKSESDSEKEKNLEELKKNVKGPLVTAVIDLAEKITKKIGAKDIKFSSLTSALKIPEGKVKSYLDRFVITTPVVVATPEGLSIEGKITVNENPLSLFVEVGKSQKGPFVIFYIEAPEKWLLSDYFPNFLPIKKLFPKASPETLAKLEKPDIVELSKSYFFFSTAAVPDHSKFGKISRGLGFKGEAKFIGFFDILDKIFALGGDPIKVSGQLNLPSLAGSHFEVIAPTQATIVPDKIKVGKKTINFIKDFKVTLSPFHLKIRLQDIGLPVLDTSGGINIYLPFSKDHLELFAGMEFYGNRLKLLAGQRQKLRDFLGIDGLDAHSFKVGFNWDTQLNLQLASAGSAFFGIGAVIGLIPLGFQFEGGLTVGESVMDITFDFAFQGQRALDFKVFAEGSFYLKDFMRFWTKYLVRDEVKLDKVIKIVPDFLFENARLRAAYSSDVKKEFEIGVDRFQMLKNVAITDVLFSISEDGLIISGAAPKVKFGKFLEITRATDREQGPYAKITLTTAPAFAAILDGRLYANLGPLGNLESQTLVDISLENLTIDSRTELLGFEAELKIKGDKDEEGKVDVKSFFLDANLTNNGRDQMGKRLKEFAKIALEEAKADLERKEQAALAALDKKVGKLVKGTEEKIARKKAQYQVEVDKCADKRKLKKKWCQAKTLPKRTKLNLEITGLKAHKKIILPGAKTFTKAFLKIGAEVLETTVEVTQFFAKALGPIVDTLNKLEKATLHIKKLSIEGSVEKLGEGKLPHVVGNGTLFKKPFSIDMQWDVKKPLDIVKQILRQVKDLFKKKEEEEVELVYELGEMGEEEINERIDEILQRAIKRGIDPKTAQMMRQGVRKIILGEETSRRQIGNYVQMRFLDWVEVGLEGDRLEKEINSRMKQIENRASYRKISVFTVNQYRKLIRKALLGEATDEEEQELIESRLLDQQDLPLVLMTPEDHLEFLDLEDVLGKSAIVAQR